jgi:hypothetical protein
MKKFVWLSPATLAAATLPVVLVGLTATDAQAQVWQSQRPIFTQQRRQINGATGFEFAGSTQRNQIQLDRADSANRCATATNTAVSAWFVSDRVSTGSQRRVKIVNVTPGLQSQPYTDREYNNSGRSEATVIEFGDSHSDQRLRVVPGQNTFAYQITDRGRVIDQGRFRATFDETAASRRYGCTNDRVLDTSPDNQPINNRTIDNRTINNRTINNRTINNRTINNRTTLSNQTDQMIFVRLDDQRLRLQPGENVGLIGQNTFNVEYRIGNIIRSAQVTPGQQLQFRGGNGRAVELIDPNGPQTTNRRRYPNR